MCSEYSVFPDSSKLQGKYRVKLRKLHAQYNEQVTRYIEHETTIGREDFERAKETMVFPWTKNRYGKL